MKIKSSNKILVISTILMFLLVTANGVISSVMEAKHVGEFYRADITLKETVVFDDPHIVKLYGGPVTLEAGEAGEISDVIDSYDGRHRHKHISASFVLDEDKTFSVKLDYETLGEKDTDVIVETFDMNINALDDSKPEEITTIEITTPVININKINDSQKIVSEFKQTRERYDQSIKQTIISGSIIAAVKALAIVAVVWLVKLIARKEKVSKALVVLTICFDGLMVPVDLIWLYLTIQH